MSGAALQQANPLQRNYVQSKRPRPRRARRFQLLIDAVVDYAIYMIDPQGVVLSWNSGAVRLKGYSAAEIIGKSFSNFYTPEDRAAGLHEKALSTARETGRFAGEGWRVAKKRLPILGHGRH